MKFNTTAMNITKNMSKLWHIREKEDKSNTNGTFTEAYDSLWKRRQHQTTATVERRRREWNPACSHCNSFSVGYAHPRRTLPFLFTENLIRIYANSLLDICIIRSFCICLAALCWCCLFFPTHSLMVLASANVNYCRRHPNPASVTKTQHVQEGAQQRFNVLLFHFETIGTLLL